MNLNVNGLTGINSLCSIYFDKDAKEKDPSNLSKNYQTA